MIDESEPLDLPATVKVRFTSERAECPMCRAKIQFIVTVKLTGGSARTTGGTIFHTNISVIINQEIIKIESEKHKCIYEQDE